MKFLLILSVLSLSGVWAWDTPTPKTTTTTTRKPPPPPPPTPIQPVPLEWAALDCYKRLNNTNTIIVPTKLAGCVENIDLNSCCCKKCRTHYVYTSQYSSNCDTEPINDPNCLVENPTCICRPNGKGVQLRLALSEQAARSIICEASMPAADRDQCVANGQPDCMPVIATSFCTKNSVTNVWKDIAWNACPDGEYLN